MLLPDQVIPFLSSDDPNLRHHAARYFEEFAGDVVPLTAEICWAAIDRIGLRRDAFELIRLLHLSRQNDASTHRLLAALDAPSDKNTRHQLFESLGKLDFEQLSRHREQILARSDLPDEVRNHILDRLELALAPLEAIWNRLDEHACQSEDHYWSELDHSVAARLIEALARHGQSSAQRAMAVINDPLEKDSAREIFAIDLLARLRHRPALESLLNRFATSDEDDDVLHESLQKGLPRIGGLDLIAPLEAIYLDQSWTFKLYATDTFARLRHPDAEAALFRLFTNPQSEDSRDMLAEALFDLCTTTALPELARLVVSGEYDNVAFELDQSLVACSLMAGFDFPELPAMREEVVARDAQYRRRVESDEFDHSPIDDLDDDLYEDDFQDEDDDDIDSFYPEVPSPPNDRTAINEPIRNLHPKIGRNDPCPCGSGKKYKKCCLNK